MSGKSLNGNGKVARASATLSPGDFSVGSMLSRAAARSMLANYGMPQETSMMGVSISSAVLVPTRGTIHSVRTVPSRKPVPNTSAK
jgi:hypothetical protein